MSDLGGVSSFLQQVQGASIARALVLLVLGLALARMLSAALGRVLARHASAQQSMIGRRVSYWIVVGLTFVSVLRQLGFDLSVLMGAAGVLTLAIGFASQTSASNLISGLFLIGEQPFVVGDMIRVAGGTMGEVVSIDLLSVKLRTVDNLFVRVPNESLLKSEIVNLTRYPIRRFDLQIGIGYHEDIGRVRSVLIDVADENPLCLEEPKPLFLFLGYGESSQNIQFSVWASRENFVELKNQLQQQVKEAFDAAGIEIPFPQRSLHVGTGTEPFPVRVVSEGRPSAPSGD